MSTVGTLADALSLGNHDLYISEVDRSDAMAARPGIAVFSLLGNAASRAGDSGLPVLVDTRELVTGIVLPDDTPPRFQALVRKVVQEHLWIPVDTLARSSLTEGCLDPGEAVSHCMAAGPVRATSSRARAG
ncbi:hypothetical protein [Bordetella sp. BOR01]|uniref:hypothetical protein n=1 Tax=Bordetella sp. BOR01 TaxID=2854779 RepID=UPI001C4915BC|nr:hypothetical protein [Bordetella sp. BOR01]MBV7481775.1 hypothetical protein [Bordetella sp. BOR01]